MKLSVAIGIFDAGAASVAPRPKLIAPCCEKLDGRFSAKQKSTPLTSPLGTVTV